MAIGKSLGQTPCSTEHSLSCFLGTLTVGCTPASDDTFCARWKIFSVDADWTDFIIELNAGLQLKQHDIVAVGLARVLWVLHSTMYLMTYLRLLTIMQIVHSYQY